MKTAILSFVYPQASRFLSDFLHSCTLQTDRDFSLLLCNDGVVDLSERIAPFASQLQITVAECRGSVVENRKAGLRLALAHGFNNLILADSDDWFSMERVALSKYLLSTSDIVCNQLVLARSPAELLRPLWLSRLHDDQVILAPAIRDGNCFGFSNTALKPAALAGEFESIPEDIVAFDWLFFAQLLERGVSARYTTRCSTFYRQHEDNVAGLLHIDAAAIHRGLSVKLRHYQCLGGRDAWFSEQARAFNQLAQQVQQDAGLAKSYLTEMTQNLPREPLWWEATRLKK